MGDNRGKNGALLKSIIGLSLLATHWEIKLSDQVLIVHININVTIASTYVYRMLLGLGRELVKYCIV